MNSTAHPEPIRSPHGRWLLLVGLLAALLLAAHGPIAQWPTYHHFADTRAWGGLPNAANVLSNRKRPAIPS